MCCRQRRGALYSGSGLTVMSISCEPYQFQPSRSVHISTASRGSVDIGVKLVSMTLQWDQAWHDLQGPMHYVGLRIRNTAFALLHGRQIRGWGLLLGNRAVLEASKLVPLLKLQHCRLLNGGDQCSRLPEPKALCLISTVCHGLQRCFLIKHPRLAEHIR